MPSSSNDKQTDSQSKVPKADGPSSPSREQTTTEEAKTETWDLSKTLASMMNIIRRSERHCSLKKFLFATLPGSNETLLRKFELFERLVYSVEKTTLVQENYILTLIEQLTRQAMDLDIVDKVEAAPGARLPQQRSSEGGFEAATLRRIVTCALESSLAALERHPTSTDITSRAISLAEYVLVPRRRERKQRNTEEYDSENRSKSARENKGTLLQKEINLDGMEFKTIPPTSEILIEIHQGGAFACTKQSNIILPTSKRSSRWKYDLIFFQIDGLHRVLSECIKRVLNCGGDGQDGLISSRTQFMETLRPAKVLLNLLETLLKAEGRQYRGHPGTIIGYIVTLLNGTMRLHLNLVRYLSSDEGCFPLDSLGDFDIRHNSFLDWVSSTSSLISDIMSTSVKILQYLTQSSHTGSKYGLNQGCPAYVICQAVLVRHIFSSAHKTDLYDICQKNLSLSVVSTPFERTPAKAERPLSFETPVTPIVSKTPSPPLARNRTAYKLQDRARQFTSPEVPARNPNPRLSRSSISIELQANRIRTRASIEIDRTIALYTLNSRILQLASQYLTSILKFANLSDSEIYTGEKMQGSRYRLGPYMTLSLAR
jgi:hypothetical protein